MLEPESEEETDNEEDTDVHMQTCVCAFIELNDYGCMQIIFFCIFMSYCNSHDFHYNFRLMLFNNIHCKRVCFIILSSLEAGQSVAVNAN